MPPKRGLLDGKGYSGSWCILQKRIDAQRRKAIIVGVGVHVSWHGASGGLPGRVSSVQVGRDMLVGQDAGGPPPAFP